MLNQQDNELLSKVGPGTPMGNLMRQYWIPFGISTELPEPDCAPVRIMILGEELVGFRDTDGKVGLLDNYCPHRRASLFFGRNEECGLRCVYHGWKFNLNGDCIDMPSEPAESNFKDKVKVTAYPVQERGGLMWAYMGPRGTASELPHLESNMVENTSIQIYQRECNWMQALEGDIDTVHTLFLHLGLAQYEDAPEGSWAWWHLQNRAPHFAAVDTEFGTLYGAFRPTEKGMNYWRFANFLMPFYAMTPPGVLGLGSKFRAWVPMDDTHTLAISVNETAPGGRRPPSEGNWASGQTETHPQGTGLFDRFRCVGDKENDYLIDRELQRTKSYAGLPSIFLEDQAVTTSMGDIVDRTKERLGTSDQMIIRTRQRLIKAARALLEGESPPEPDHPEWYGVRSGGVMLPVGVDWVEASSELRKGFIKHPKLDLAVIGGVPAV
jgi:phenylpropionate dioxygenase-like ring-hydroxylating dioxygenase large terminal subunit